MPRHARRLKIRRKDLRKPDEFETLTGQAVAWADEHRPVVYGVLAVALVGLARAKEAAGDTAGALDAYTQAGSLPGAYRDDALLSAARLEHAAGHAERAQAIYAGLLKDAADPATKAFVAAKVPGAVRP